ncbi:MAG: ribosome biogenesis GTPase Der [Alphaproteobacteria bacterium]|nr:ribosome biogenesis GTPase Der [Alphaproteobacteria bacterium]
MVFNIAIVGRPNVGKSTLFNRLVGKKLAIVNDYAGVTRDWKESEARLRDMEFNIIDTAGWENMFDDSVPGKMRAQTESVIKNVDLAILLFDARQGITPIDKKFANIIRKEKIPVILVANKCESRTALDNLVEAYELGMGEPVKVAAEHGIGMDDLYKAIKPIYDDYENYEFDEDDPQNPIKLAIVGRPNVGKSTLINTIIGEDRVLTGPEAGITRDSIAVEWEHEGRKLRLVDTAGMRKKSRIKDHLEKASVSSSTRAIRLAQIVVLMVDANAILDKQDLLIAKHVIEEGRALILAVNKWDSAKNKEAALTRIKDKLDLSLSQIKGVPVVTMSALHKKNVNKLLDEVLDIYDIWHSRVTTGELNRWLDYAVCQHLPPLTSNKREQKIRYMTQTKTNPPTFALFVSKPKDLPDSYKRYLLNGLREEFGIKGVPIRIMVRTSKNPYVDKK